MIDPIRIVNFDQANEVHRLIAGQAKSVLTFRIQEINLAFTGTLQKVEMSGLDGGKNISSVLSITMGRLDEADKIRQRIKNLSFEPTIEISGGGLKDPIVLENIAAFKTWEDRKEGDGGIRVWHCCQIIIDLIKPK